jgi:hypothetical protein
MRRVTYCGSWCDLGRSGVLVFPFAREKFAPDAVALSPEEQASCCIASLVMAPIHAGGQRTRVAAAEGLTNADDRALHRVTRHVPGHGGDVF